MRVFALCALCFIGIGVAAPALALEDRLVPLSGMNIVVVWKSSDAQSEGMQLIAAGALNSDPSLVAQLISCIVPGGTKAIITDAGFATHDITVVGGEFSGCRGNIPMENWD